MTTTDMTTEMTTQTTVVSRDGTPIAYWSAGDGPPLLLVHGTTANHTTFDPALPYLTPHVAVHCLDRRGRGGSGDADAYDLEREFEDIAAVIDHLADITGSRVDLFGHSFGGLCAFGAVRRTGNVRRLVLYEGWPVPDPAAILEPEVMDRVDGLLAAGDDEAALAVFYRDGVGMSDELLDAFRASPKWPARVAAAPTIPREAAAVQEAGTRDLSEAAGIDVPVLLLIGGESPDHLSQGSHELVSVLPDARIAELEGQQHLAYLEAPELFAQTVLAFLRPTQVSDSRNGG